MSRPEDALYLRHIQEAIVKAMAWAGSSRQAFFLTGTLSPLSSPQWDGTRGPVPQA